MTSIAPIKPADFHVDNSRVALAFGKDLAALSSTPAKVSFDTDTAGAINVSLPSLGDKYVYNALFNHTVHGVALTFTAPDNGHGLGLLPEPAQAAKLLGQLPDVASAVYTQGNINTAIPAGGIARPGFMRDDQIDITATSAAAATRLRSLLASRYSGAAVYVFNPMDTPRTGAR